MRHFHFGTLTFFNTAPNIAQNIARNINCVRQILRQILREILRADNRKSLNLGQLSAADNRK
jgi:hypothetical protein